MCKWIKESNRWKHMVGGFALSVVFTFFCALGSAIGMEFKDCHYYNGDAQRIVDWDWRCWDWLDFLATCIGGIIGQAVQLLIIYLIFF